MQKKETKMSSRVLVIGVSGPTNSGKTTVVNRLVKDIDNCHSICQDHYFMMPGDDRLAPLYIPNLDHHNWEDYRALEMSRMVEDVKEKICQLRETSQHEPSILIIEGFSIFGWSPLLSMLQKKYFLSVDRDVCEQRRLSRNYDPPDVAGYFRQIVWPMHEKHLKSIQHQKDIVFMDCNQSVDHIYQKILSDVCNFKKQS